MSTLIQIDTREQLRSLYMSLVTRQDRFDEMKDLLATYPDPEPGADVESEAAYRVREEINERMREWTRTAGGGLSPLQVLGLRDMMVSQRLFLALSPWKEANTY